VYFDALTTSAVADELNARLVGGRVQQAVLVDDLTLGLEIYVPPQRHYLVLSAHPQWARVHLTAEKARRGVEVHSPLLLLLRKHVRDARLVRVSQPPYERIIRLSFVHPEHGETTLIAEVMGKHSNVILLGPDDIILECLKRIGPEINRYRTIQPRQAYLPPPAQAKLDPDQLNERELRSLLESAGEDRPLWRALVDGLRGVSPLLGRELSFRAYGRADCTVGEAADIGPLLCACDDLYRAATRSPWQPCVAHQADELVAFAPYLLTHLAGYEQVASISQAVERYIAAQTSRDPYAAARRRVRTLIEAAWKQLERKRQSLERSLQPADDIERLRRAGEWILAYAHQLAPGQSSLKVVDAEDSPPLEIALDPTKSPVENAQSCFDRYGRARKAAQEVPPLLAEVALAEEYLQQLLTDLDLASTQPEIEDVRRALEEAGYGKPSGRRAPSPRSQPMVVQSADGFTILVGKNSRQNEEVTFKQANADDIWLHVRGAPGAHVIIRCGNRPVPERTLRQAAQLAAYFSAARADGQVAVDYTRQRQVRRIKGAGPGMVTYRAEKTLYVTPQPPGAGP